MRLLPPGLLLLIIIYNLCLHYVLLLINFNSNCDHQIEQKAKANHSKAKWRKRLLRFWLIFCCHHYDGLIDECEYSDTANAMANATEYPVALSWLNCLLCPGLEVWEVGSSKCIQLLNWTSALKCSNGIWINECSLCGRGWRGEAWNQTINALLIAYINDRYDALKDACVARKYYMRLYSGVDRFISYPGLVIFLEPIFAFFYGYR